MKMMFKIYNSELSYIIHISSWTKVCTYYIWIILHVRVEVCCGGNTRLQLCRRPLLIQKSSNAHVNESKHYALIYNSTIYRDSFNSEFEYKKILVFTHHLISIYGHRKRNAYKILHKPESEKLPKIIKVLFHLANFLA